MDFLEAAHFCDNEISREFAALIRRTVLYHSFAHEYSGGPERTNKYVAAFCIVECRTASPVRDVMNDDRIG